MEGGALTRGRVRFRCPTCPASPYSMMASPRVASLSRRARFLTSSHVAGRVYSDTLGMSGHHGIDGPALAVLDHFFVALIEKDALGRSRDVASVRGHSCARFGARHRVGRWREAFTDDSLDRLLIRRNVGSGRFGWGVGHSSKSRRERAEDQAAWREFASRPRFLRLSPGVRPCERGTPAINCTSWDRWACLPPK